ncbi:hypothetical protein BH10PSE11_BH10PSE11_08310 [soil metagenome]
MIYIETANVAEARRARRIQFSGLATKFEINGTTFAGKIIAVNEDRLRKLWTIQCVESPFIERIATRKPRPLKAARDLRLAAQEAVVLARMAEAEKLRRTD